MEKTISENNQRKTYVLNHNKISLFVGDTNQTHSEPARFEVHMGYYCEEDQSWIFPSPLDAIKAYQSIQAQ